MLVRSSNDVPPPSELGVDIPKILRKTQYVLTYRLTKHDLDDLDLGGPLVFVAILGAAHLLVRECVPTCLHCIVTTDGQVQLWRAARLECGVLHDHLVCGQQHGGARSCKQGRSRPVQLHVPPRLRHAPHGTVRPCIAPHPTVRGTAYVCYLRFATHFHHAGAW